MAFETLERRNRITNADAAEKMTLTAEEASANHVKNDLTRPKGGFPVTPNLKGEFIALEEQPWRETERGWSGSYWVAIFKTDSGEKAIELGMFTAAIEFVDKDYKEVVAERLKGGAADIIAANGNLCKKGVFGRIFKGLKGLGKGHFVVATHYDYAVGAGKDPKKVKQLNFVSDTEQGEQTEEE